MSVCHVRSICMSRVVYLHGSPSASQSPDAVLELSRLGVRGTRGLGAARAREAGCLGFTCGAILPPREQAGGSIVVEEAFAPTPEPCGVNSEQCFGFKDLLV